MISLLFLCCLYFGLPFIITKLAMPHGSNAEYKCHFEPCLVLEPGAAHFGNHHGKLVNNQVFSQFPKCLDEAMLHRNELS